MKNKKTLIEIFFVAIIIIVFTSFIFFQFYKIKISIRNSVRKGNIADIQKALLFYHNSTRNYPISQGECINQNSSITKKLEEIKLVNKIPEDPMWSSIEPSSVNDKGTPTKNSTNFCFWYVSDGNSYKLFYYLEPTTEGQKQRIASTTEKAVK